MRAGPGAPHAHKSLRCAGQPARETSGSRAKPGTADPGRRARSVKAAREAALDD